MQIIQLFCLLATTATKESSRVVFCSQTKLGGKNSLLADCISFIFTLKNPQTNVALSGLPGSRVQSTTAVLYLSATQGRKCSYSLYDLIKKKNILASKVALLCLGVPQVEVAAAAHT